MTATMNRAPFRLTESKARTILFNFNYKQAYDWTFEQLLEHMRNHPDLKDLDKTISDKVSEARLDQNAIDDMEEILAAWEEGRTIDILPEKSNGTTSTSPAPQRRKKGKGGTKTTKRGRRKKSEAPPESKEETPQEPKEEKAVEEWTPTPPQYKMVTHPKTIKVTKTKAKEHLALPDVPGPRPFQKKRYEERLRDIQEGSFRTCEWATVKYTGESIPGVVKKGDEMRVNGRHTAEAFTYCFDNDIELPHAYYVARTNYETDTLQGISDLFATFDDRGSSRTSADINHVVASSVTDLKDVKKKIINLAVTALGYVQFGRENWKGARANERANLLRDNVEVVHEIDDLVKEATEPPKHLLRGAVVAAIIATYRKDDKDAKEFWSGIRDGANLEKDSPELSLRNFLFKVIVNPGSGAGGGNKKSVSFHELYYQCIAHWNVKRNPDEYSLPIPKYNADNEAEVC